ncbi:kinetochore protein Spc25 isoform X2 [Oncorhynchus mykiss]|uniref:kinetochore protein Spc25 isoform X2 n=1 Tax=Oncorhynchus mykiss TaxID=8022 RepID=UPI000B4F21D7|nr:kinetochore protein Spc25 isoform X2 [Oncorhynchus mykiss]
MNCITDANIGNWFSSTMEDIRNKMLFQGTAEMTETGMDWVQTHRKTVRSVLDTCSKKCKDDEIIFETIDSYKTDLENKNASLVEKRNAIAKRLSEVEGKNEQKSKIIEKIEMVRVEQAKKKKLIVSQNKANKDRLKNLNKAKQVFQGRLGLEIRKIHEKLQFIFRDINPRDSECVYTFMLRISEGGLYQIVSSDPPLDCMAHLEQRLQETNNFSAFLANVRREFLALKPQ